MSELAKLGGFRPLRFELESEAERSQLLHDVVVEDVGNVPGAALLRVDELDEEVVSRALRLVQCFLRLDELAVLAWTAARDDEHPGRDEHQENPRRRRPRLPALLAQLADRKRGGRRRRGAR